MARITAVRCIRTRHDGSWVILKVMTDQDGLYGIGSASDMYQPRAVVSIVEELLAPLLIGRDASQIEDLWQTMYTSGYWRNGSTLHTAMGGIDMALWDIKGKEAGLPVYQLLGGAVRSAIPCYAHANGATYEELEEEVSSYQEQGFGVIRCQLGGYGGGGFVASQGMNQFPSASVFDEAKYITAIPNMFEKLRVRFGMNLNFTHDVHEHLTPSGAVTLSRLLDPYRLFFLEDLLQSEHTEWYRRVKETSITPQAIGELFVHPQEWLPLVTNRLIDFVRMRVSKAGGITPCRKANNVMSTYNIMEAASKLGIQRVVFGSSESAYGFCWAKHPFAPHQLPVDEDHVLLPQESYGLSKQVNEQTGDMFARRVNMQVYALRFSLILAPEEYTREISMFGDTTRHHRTLWSYVDARDAAIACRMALEAESSETSDACRLNVTSSDILSSESIRDLAAKYYPQVPFSSQTPDKLTAFVSNARAKSILNWKPAYSWKDTVL